MDTEIRKTINATDKDAQYDEKAKRLLGQKIILAHILVKTVDEFYGMNPNDVIPFIEGTPFIGAVPLENGLTNYLKENEGQRIVGFNTESSEIKEGLIRFDIVFYVRMRDGLTQMIVNVEAQKDEPFRYEILNRAIFYVSRLISSQKERDFDKTNYNDMKRVYSIWICMNMNENNMSYVHLTKNQLLGSYEWKGKMDLFNIVLIGLGKELPQHDEKYELHRLLGTLLSRKLSANEKLDIIEKEYDIPVEDSMRKDVSVMCNLSQGIREEGREEGRDEVIICMYKKGLTLEQIADITEKEVQEIKAIIEKEETVLV